MRYFALHQQMRVMECLSLAVRHAHLAWRRVGRACAILTLTLCSACSTSGFWLVHPRGPTTQASLQAWIVDTAATLLVIGPATILVFWAIWRYRRATGKGKYVPGWSHSIPIELACWGFPFLVVLGLGFYSLHSSLAVDPAGPGIIAAGTSADAAKPPINIDVVTTDWQWLFIYPDRHIAVANKLVVPVNTPVRFRLTSSTVATDFFIPQLAGQIDVMPGMRTWQGMIANEVGSYEGFASDYNGPGFAWMRFQVQVVSDADYERWATAAQAAPTRLDDAVFKKFATPTINYKNSVTEFSRVEDGFFDHVMERVMMGDVYPTPANMTEKKAHKVNDGKQETSASQNIGADQTDAE